MHKWQDDFDTFIRPLLPNWRPVPAEHTPGELEEYEAAPNWPQVQAQTRQVNRIASGGMLRMPALLIIPLVAPVFAVLFVILRMLWTGALVVTWP